MDEKLQKIMNKIGVSPEYLEEFKNARLDKNRVDDLNNTVYIEIINDDDISISFYDELVDKFNKFFDADIELEIINETRNSTHFQDHFDSKVTI